ncbi:hypothetical protein LIER_03963 [Lithospermum erythrorhizon]|uniref:Fe2OG dioxygenase domain-containing protein n=1 Tax=Lithospermum erythrorhizon TaxID=34254 RepID=A0AAV3NW74_LITER
MVGESDETPRSSGSDSLEILKTMSKHDILEIISQGLCNNCDKDLQKRIQDLNERKASAIPTVINDKEAGSESNSLTSEYSETEVESSETDSLPENVKVEQTPEFLYNRKRKEDGSDSEFSPKSRSRSPSWPSEHELMVKDILGNSSLVVGNPAEVEEREHGGFEQVNRREFSFLERINGQHINILEGLELHHGVFNIQEQNEIVQYVYKLQHIGREGLLRARTYSEPRKWIRGKGRVTIQFGCCYNYAKDKDGNPPGIKQDEKVDPLPSLFKQMIKRMVRWHVLPPSCVPDSCIVNIYEEEDCIPPHIDHHDFVRPFCTVSLLSECDILFGSSLKIISPGEFSGPVSIPLPVGSVMVFKGNGADVAKHCIPSVPSKRISITFRKMDDSKLPFNYSHDPELLAVKPLIYSPFTRPSAPNDHNQHKKTRREDPQHVGEIRGKVFQVEEEVEPLIYSPFTRPSTPNDHDQRKKLRRGSPRHVEEIRGDMRDKVFHVEDDDLFTPRRSMQPYGRYPRRPLSRSNQRRVIRENRFFN